MKWLRMGYEILIRNINQNSFVNFYICRISRYCRFISHIRSRPTMILLVYVQHLFFITIFAVAFACLAFCKFWCKMDFFNQNFLLNIWLLKFVFRSELGETDTESEIGAQSRKGRRVSHIWWFSTYYTF